MTEFDSMNKALKAPWVRRFNTDINAPRKIIPNYMTQHLGGFMFLLSCNYKMKELTLNNIPSFYVEILKSWNIILCTNSILSLLVLIHMHTIKTKNRYHSLN